MIHNFEMVEEPMFSSFLNYQPLKEKDLRV